MSNPFDNKIKESLENFEMPYDAGAWAELAQQLPAANGAASGGSQLGWKAAALVAVVATTIATALYLTNSKETVTTDSVAIEQVAPVVEQSAQSIPTQEATEPSVSVADKLAKNESVAEDSNPSSSESTTTTDREQITSAKTNNASNVAVENPTTTEKNVVEPTVPVQAMDVNPFQAKFLPSALITCVGEDLSFINASSDKSASMKWDFGDGTIETETDPVHSYVTEGTYRVRLVGSKGNESAEYEVQVTVNPTPMPIFSAERKLNGYVAIPLYKFNTAIQPSETAVWSFSDGTKLTGTSAQHLFRDAGTGSVLLTVTNNYGCSSSMSETYDVIKDFDLLAPNTFSPNGDGINELFIPAALPEMGVAFEMSILNPKTNEVVYRTSNALEPWNGTRFNSGEVLEDGIYIWTVVLNENIVSNKIFNGKITLSR